MRTPGVWTKRYFLVCEEFEIKRRQVRGKSVAVNLRKKLWKELSAVLLVQRGKTERQAWGNLPVPPLWSACIWNMKVLFPEDYRGKNEKPHPVAFQLTGKQKPDLPFFASIADCLWSQKEERSREATSRLNWAVLYHHLLLCHHGWHILSALSLPRTRTQSPLLTLCSSPNWIWMWEVEYLFQFLTFILSPYKWLIMVIWDLGKNKSWKRRDAGKETGKKEVTWADFCYGRNQKS